MPVIVPTYQLARRAPRREHAFGVIEVIVAMLIVTFVVVGAAAAVMSSSSSETSIKATADTHAIARRATERLRTDLSAQTACTEGATGTSMNTGWKASAQSATSSASAAAFDTCTYTYNDMRDAQRRLYLVTAKIKAVDDDSDGTGATDSDKNLRDRYDVSLTVALDASSRSAGVNPKALTVASTLAWNNGLGGDELDIGFINLNACAYAQPVNVIAGVCKTGDSSRTRIPSQVTITRSDGTSMGTITAQGSAGALAPGRYKLAPTTKIVSETGNLYNYYDMSPVELTVKGGQSYDVFETFVAQAKKVEVCTQITNYSNPDYNRGDVKLIHDYEVKQTNLYFRHYNAAGYDSTRLALSKDFQGPTPANGWNCSAQITTHVLNDPLTKDAKANGTGLFEGTYDLQVEQVKPTATPQGLVVKAMATGCTMPNYNNALGGTPLSVRSSTSFDSSAPTSSYYTRALLGGNVNRLCIRFESMPMRLDACTRTGSNASSCVFYSCTMAVPGENPYTVGYVESTDCNPQDRVQRCYLDAGASMDADCGAGFDANIGCQYNAGAIPGQQLPYFVVAQSTSRPCNEGTFWSTCETATDGGGGHYTDDNGDCWDGTQVKTCAMGGPYNSDPDGTPCTGDERNIHNVTTPICVRDGSDTNFPATKAPAGDGSCAPASTGTGSFNPAGTVVQQFGGGYARTGAGTNFRHPNGINMPGWISTFPNNPMTAAGGTGGRSADGTNFNLGWSISGGVDDTSTRCTSGGGHGGAGEYGINGKPKAMTKSDGTAVNMELDGDRVNNPDANRLLFEQPTFECAESTFSAGWQVVNTFGMWSCLELYLENRPNDRIRGRLIDFAPGRNDTSMIQIHLGAAQQLIPAGNVPILDSLGRTEYYPGVTGTNWDVYDYAGSTGGLTGFNLLTPAGNRVDVPGYNAVVHEVDDDLGCSGAATGTTVTYSPSTVTNSVSDPVPFSLPIMPLSSWINNGGVAPSDITFRKNATKNYRANYDDPSYSDPSNGVADPSMGTSDISL